MAEEDKTMDKNLPIVVDAEKFNSEMEGVDRVLAGEARTAEEIGSLINAEWELMWLLRGVLTDNFGKIETGLRLSERRPELNQFIRNNFRERLGKLMKKMMDLAKVGGAGASGVKKIDYGGEFSGKQVAIPGEEDVEAKDLPDFLRKRLMETHNEITDEMAGKPEDWFDPDIEEEISGWNEGK